MGEFTQTSEWQDVLDWKYVKTKKELIEWINSFPDDSEIKKDVRVLKYLPDNQVIIQFKNHDFS